MTAWNILHLVGSPTSIFHQELSELYARGCAEALAKDNRFRFFHAHVSPDGLWRFPPSLGAAALAASATYALPDALAKLRDLRIDIALPQMFCLRGMTEYRGLLDLLGITYLGNRPLQMALAADKSRARALVCAAGVDVPAGEVLWPGDAPAMPLPVVVKPNDADNSEGVSLVRSIDQYPAALAGAFAHSGSVLVEKYIALGREVRCGVIERQGVLTCLPLEEYRVDETHRPIRLRNHKLQRDSADRLELAAKAQSESWIVNSNDPVVNAVWHAAKQCHTALGCRQYSLCDFRVDPDGTPFFLEASLYCSFSPQSVMVNMMQAAGTPLANFLDQTIEEALAGALTRTLVPQH